MIKGTSVESKGRNEVTGRADDRGYPGHQKGIRGGETDREQRVPVGTTLKFAYKGATADFLGLERDVTILFGLEIRLRQSIQQKRERASRELRVDLSL